ncbi:MAG: HAD hydrolase-like protein, partial [Pseudomonadota bacterium]
DNRDGIIASVEHALSCIEEPIPDRASLLRWIGPPLKTSFETHLGSAETADRALAFYRERYSDTGLLENRVYDGVPEMIEQLGALGCRLWLATSKPAVFAKRIVAHFGLDHLLDGVFGSELDGRRSDKVDLLAHALAQIPARTAIMLGDREFDMIGARANGCTAVGALWGFGSKAELVGSGAHYLAATPLEAAARIQEIVK